MRWRVCVVALASAILWGAPAASSARSPSSEDTIVVTGEREKAARQKAESYVRELRVATGEQPTARWFDPICPRALGLGKEHAAIVEEQIRQIVRDVGAPLAGRGCDPNFAIAFTDGPERIVKHIAGSRGGLPLRDARELKEGNAPMRWWYNTDLRSTDGMPASDASVPWATLDSPSYSPLPTGSSGSLPQYNSSMVSTQSVRTIYSATVVIDVNRAEGVPLKSVVDYAALVGLSEIALGASPTDSVLSLFQPGGSRALSGRDRAFLRSLYQIAMDRESDRQRRAIVKEMVSEKEPN